MRLLEVALMQQEFVLEARPCMAELCITIEFLKWGDSLEQPTQRTNYLSKTTNI